MNISDSIASEPLPEKGLTRTSLHSSLGIPKIVKKGDKQVDTILASPLISNSSVKTKMLTK